MPIISAINIKIYEILFTLLRFKVENSPKLDPVYVGVHYTVIYNDTYIASVSFNVDNVVCGSTVDSRRRNYKSIIPWLGLME